jgi:hypothetical protein
MTKRNSAGEEIIRGGQVLRNADPPRVLVLAGWSKLQDLLAQERRARVVDMLLRRVGQRRSGD